MNKNFVSIHKGLSLFLKANRFVRYMSGLKMTRAEIHTLIELSARNESTIKNLTQVLNMSQSSVSRLVKNLVRDGLLSQSASKIDKRSKILKLTSKGKKTVKLIDAQAGPKIKERANRLNKDEREILLNFYNHYTSLFNQPTSPIRAGEDEIRLQERRLTRTIGILNGNVFNSGLSSPQWSVLFDVYNHEYPLNAKIISKNQCIPPNNLSQVLNYLEKEKLIERKQALLDSRFIEIKITSKGKKVYKEIENHVCRDLKKALENYSTRKREVTVQTFLKYLDVDNISEIIKTKSTFSINKANLNDIIKIRKFAVRQLFKCEISEHTPEVLVSKNSIIYTLNNEEMIVSAVEFQKVNKSTLSLSLLVSKRSLAPVEIVNFVLEVTKILKKAKIAKTIEVNFMPAIKVCKKAKLLDKSKTIKL